MKFIIHKSKKNYYNGFIEVSCGILVRYRHSSYRWDKVNCKRCLKTKNEINKDKINKN